MGCYEASGEISFVYAGAERTGEGGGYVVWVMFKNEYYFRGKDRVTGSFFCLDKMIIRNIIRII